MDISAVIFDWGGTLTPWRAVDVPRIWAVVARQIDPGRAEELGARLTEVDRRLWHRSKEEHRAFTIEDVFEAAGVTPTPDALAALHDEWVPATFTDPQALTMLSTLRQRGIRTGILSNTPWPRRWHDDWLRRDGVLHHFDTTVYTSDLPWNKPHPDTFHLAMEAIGVTDPRTCVYVGDRLFEDVWGAHQVGMRAVHIPHSEIPEEQRGRSESTPDAVIQGLDELPTVVNRWMG